MSTLYWHCTVFSSVIGLCSSIKSLGWTTPKKSCAVRVPFYRVATISNINSLFDKKKGKINIQNPAAQIMPIHLCMISQPEAFTQNIYIRHCPNNITATEWNTWHIDFQMELWQNSEQSRKLVISQYFTMGYCHGNNIKFWLIIEEWTLGHTFIPLRLGQGLVIICTWNYVRCSYSNSS